MKQIGKLCLAIGCLLLCGAVNWARPATPPDHDTYVDVNDAEKNFNGNQLEVSASLETCEPTSITFLQWDLTHIPAYSAVQTATLKLTAFGAMNNAEGTWLALYATGDNWTEDTLTYANAPALGTRIESRPLPLSIPPEGQAVIFTDDALRLYLEEQLADDQIASFALRLEGRCDIGYTVALFYDSESQSDVPDLYLETQVRPTDVTIGKAGPASASPGQMITYTVTYTNTGPLPVRYALITDTLPAQLQVYTYTHPLIPLQPNNTLMWEVRDLAPGDNGTLTITGLISPAFTGWLTNTATITTTAIESDTTNNVSLPVVTLVQAADLVMHKSGPPVAVPGERITYTLVYTNAGNARVPQAVVVDHLPAAAQIYDYTGSTLPPQDNTLLWEILDLAPGQAGVLTVTATISPTFGGVLTNTATIATTVFEADTTNNVAPPVVTVVQVPDLVMHKSGPPVAVSGERITYTLVYTNVGDAMALQVVVTDTLEPAEMAIPPTVWQVGDLAPGAGGTLTLPLAVPSTFEGWLTNTVTIAARMPEVNTDNNTSYVVTRIAALPHYTLYLPLILRTLP